MHEIPPENLVDRSSELDEFSSMLRFETETRLLTIRDEQGTGKTELLRILEYNCKYRFQPRVPVSRVLLDDKGITDTFAFVKRVRDQLTKSKCQFRRFDYYESARLNHYWTPFAPAAPGPPPGQTYRGQIDLQDAKIGGTPRLAGVNVEKAGSVIINEPQEFPSSPMWASPDQEPQAREKCVRAFLDDLREIADAQPITVLIDTFEKHEDIPDMETWVIDELVLPLCFDEHRAKRFLLVLSGRRLPNFVAMLPEGRQLVASRDSLTWEDDHVRDFLALHGFGALPVDDVQFVCQKVRLGFSISSALKLAETLAAGVR